MMQLTRIKLMNPLPTADHHRGQRKADACKCRTDDSWRGLVVRFVSSWRGEIFQGGKAALSNNQQTCTTNLICVQTGLG